MFITNPMLRQAREHASRLGELTALHWFYGLLRVSEDNQLVQAPASSQVLDYLALVPPNEPWEVFLPDLGWWGFFWEDEAGERLCLALGLNPTHLRARTDLNWGAYHEVPQQGNDWEKLLAGFTQGSRPLERIFRQLQADPAQAEAWLKQQSGASLIPIHLKSVARLLDEARTRPEVLLCLWHLGITGSAKRAFDILSEGMMAPRYQADLATLRHTLNAYRGHAESVDGPTVLRAAARHCLAWNVLPQTPHLMFAALHVDDPRLALALTPADRELLVQHLKSDILGTLPPDPLRLHEGHLYSGDRLLLSPEDAHHKAEALVGLGRVGRWVDQRLRVHASAGAVDRIELA